MKCLIIGNAPNKDINYILDVYNLYYDKYVVCVDGGLDIAVKLGLNVDICIGDFDSYNILDCVCKVIRLPREKDDTDMLYAVKHIISEGYSEIVMLNVLGGRMDHAMLNLSILEYGLNHNAAINILDRDNAIFIYPNYDRDIAENYKYISIIPIDSILKSVTLSGFKYNILEKDIYRDRFISVSNEIHDSGFSIDIGEGRAFIVFSRDSM